MSANTTADITKTEKLTQEQIVLAFLQDRKDDDPSDFSASQIHETLRNSGLIDYLTPLTSIRRTLNNLMGKELIRKTNLQISGPFGKPEHTWEYAVPVKKGKRKNAT